MIPRGGTLRAWLGAMSDGDDTTIGADDGLVTAWLTCGDDRAGQALVARHRRRIVHVAAGVLGPRGASEAEDVAQEAFVRAFSRLATLRDRAQFGSWVARIAFHLAIERRRLARNRLPHIALDDRLPANAAPSDILVRRAVEELPAVPRAVLHLHYWLGYSVEEIGELLHIPVNTVKSHLSRGRQRLARRLEGTT